MSNKQQGIILSVLMMEGSLDGVWIAVCLERYIMAQGNSKHDVIRELKAMLAAEAIYGLEHGNPMQPLAGIEPAPAEYWDVYETAVPCDPPSMEINITIKSAPDVLLPEVGQVRQAA